METMTDIYSILNYVSTFLFFIAGVILFIASLSLASKQKNIYTTIMVVASLASIILSLSTTLFYYLIGSLGGDYQYGMILTILGGLSSIAFAGALLMFAMHQVKKPLV